MERATGTRKNLLLTLWLVLPILLVASIIIGIFKAYSSEPAMDARPVGQGAGDTGGANAIGELLAGNDPDRIERRRRELREGRLIDPVDWPYGVRLVVRPGKTGMGDQWIWLWGGKGGPPPSLAVAAGPNNPEAGAVEGGGEFVSISHDQFRRIHDRGRPGAGLYISATRVVTPRGGTLVDEAGRTLKQIDLPLVSREEVTEGEPVEVEVLIDG